MAPDTPPPTAMSMAMPPRVLLVEDGLVNQYVAAGILRRIGCHVTVAENGEVAIRCWEEQPFDIILMDLQMPVLNGLQATAVIREREAVSGKRIPIIAMTATEIAGDRDNCLAGGMDDYISKPIAADALQATIARHLKGAATVEPATPLPHPPGESDIVDFETALTQVPGGREVLNDLARIFLMECPKLLNDLRKGLADEDVEATHRAVHTLKGAARILAANRLTQIASELETLAKGGQLATVRSRFGEVQEAVDQACGLIKAWRE